jgi:hypothetical protein
MMRRARVLTEAAVEAARPKRLLVYDVETYAVGFADPAWVPQLPTCIAWKFLGQAPSVATSLDFRDINGPMPHLDPVGIRDMLEEFQAAYDAADAVVTYNGLRFDQPILNGGRHYAGMTELAPKLVYDLHLLGRVKGVKKGLDNLAVHYRLKGKKQTMNHAQWQDAYLEEDWATIKSRAVSDVKLTEQLYHKLDEVGRLRPPRRWKP